ncbi:MAG: DUF1015 family protein [Acidothermaceae bacterium]
MATPPPRAFRLRPFRAIRYADGLDRNLAAVLAPPYDVIDEDQRVALESRDPHNVVRLILPREPTDATDADATGDRYAHAAALMNRWLDEGVLAVDEHASLYVYQQRQGETITQRGLFGALLWQPLDAGVILPHENVRSGPVEDRLALMRAMRANPEPIFLLYDGGGAASRISAAAVSTAPVCSATDADGVTHELWTISSSDDIAAIADDLDSRTAMIADGHHRYTTYGYLRDELHAAGLGAGPWDYGLALLVDDSVATPEIKAIHRAIPGLSLAAAIDQARAGFAVRELDAVADTAAALAELGRCDGTAYVVGDGARFMLLSKPDTEQLAAAKPVERTDAWWALDASIASVFLMQRLWGVADGAGRVEAEHDPQSAVRLAQQTNGVALLLNPAPLAGIVAVAEAGDAMPRKSTLFMPKPCSGMVMRAFRYETAAD